MIYLVPIPVITGGVIIGDTVGLVSVDFNNIKKVSEDVDSLYTVIEYYNGSIQQLNITFDLFLGMVKADNGFALIDIPELCKTSKAVSTFVKRNNIINR